MKTVLKTLEKTLHYRFKNRDLLRVALTHPSFRHEQGNEAVSDNQRLEFLGDAVIGLLSAEHLFGLEGEMGEGDMTKFRSGITSRGGLAQVGEAWQIGPMLLMGRGETQSGGASRDSNLADAVEAVIGAVYQDGGMKAARKLYQRHFAPRMETRLDLNPDLENPKGSLQELSQKTWQQSPEYQIVEELGPAHARQYVAAVSIRGEEIARGIGMSKRAAEAAAAAEGLEKLRQKMRKNESAQLPSGQDRASSTVTTSS
ncbi:MAG: ribonuclease III [Verrucomicrobia bacterium]|nr:ribonuclease III [Verrucomicrobiota bacterium]MCH8511711.1 ribonuclease III [Kiritimatiellia bacterium]